VSKIAMPEKKLLRFKNKGANKKKTLNKTKRGIIQILMTLVAVLFATPILTIINYSFKTTRELYLSSPLALPQSPNFANYISAFRKLDLHVTFTNTFFYTFVSVAVLALLCGAAAWAIARNKSKIFQGFYIYFLLGIFIPYQSLFLSIYIVGFKTGLVNTRMGLILMYIATGMSFGVFLMTSFMSTVPLELEEAAKIDGCSVYRTYFCIVLPLLKPAIATLTILQAFQIWNDYLMASLFISSQKLRTITLAMQLLFSHQASDYTTAMAAIIISVLPVTILFVSLQKYFVQGMTAGALKS